MPRLIGCDEFKELASALVLGVLDAEERAACRAHLARADHAGCREKLAEALETSARLVETLPRVEPAPRLWRLIEARIANAPQSEREHKRFWREIAGWFMTAAVVGASAALRP